MEAEALSLQEIEVIIGDVSNRYELMLWISFTQNYAYTWLINKDHILDNNNSGPHFSHIWPGDFTQIPQGTTAQI